MEVKVNQSTEMTEMTESLRTEQIEDNKGVCECGTEIIQII
jgi:hypothetical protein